VLTARSATDVWYASQVEMSAFKES
jgi:hypothetical protein